MLLFGRLENGESFVVMNYARPYFYIRKQDLEKAQNLAEFEFQESDFKNFDGEIVVKIILDIPKDVPEVRRTLEQEGVVCYEADIRFAYRFMIDHNLQGCVDINGDYDSGEYVDRVYKEAAVKHASFQPKLKTMALDIETNAKATRIYCISMVFGDQKFVLIHSGQRLKNAVNCASEEELLRTFQRKMLELDPDIITGWNVIDFDLKVIQQRFKKYGIPFVLGRDNTSCRIIIEKDFFVSSKADFPGRVVIDALDLLKVSFIKVEDYKLGTVAKGILGEDKLLKFKDKGNEIESLYKDDQQTLVDYNLKDSELVMQILEKTKMLALSVQRSILTGMPLDRVHASIASLDSLYLKRAMMRKLVVPSARYVQKERGIVGGYVKEPQYGIYENVIVLDFKSLYPSIIRTFNIDPAAYDASCKKGSLKTPTGICFKKETGILPEIIEELWKHREEARKKKDELSRHAIKILMNSFFGVLASPSCRFFSMEVANAITMTGQYILKLTTGKIEEMGFKVIYNDTDSCFVLSHAKDHEGAVKVGKEIRGKINDFYKIYLKKEFKRNSYLELEFDRCFLKLLLPKMRSAEQGAKKRYAGIVLEDGKEVLDITGLEAIRGDWTPLAKKFQMDLLGLVFHKKDVVPYITQLVKDLKAGKLDDLLVYKKSIRKELGEYTATTPQHVKAARKLDVLDGNVVRYVVTTDGPEPVQKIKHAIDYRHYLEKQLKPIADSILLFFNKKFEDIVAGSKQMNLMGF